MTTFRMAAAIISFCASLPATASGSPLFNTIYPFANADDGATPSAELTNVNGILYGTTAVGGTNGSGTIFKFDPASQTLTTLYTFNAFSTLGSQPVGRLAYVNGSLYGVTFWGGPAGFGNIFKFDLSNNTLNVVYNFTDGATGAWPQAGLVYSHGFLYGTTSGDQVDEGSMTTYGSVYKLEVATGTVTALHSFGGAGDGAVPFSDLTLINGRLYGTTAGGGSSNAGTLFEIDPSSGNEIVLYSFSGADDGRDPVSGLTAGNGALYGTADGGATSFGVLYKFDLASRTQTVLHSFSGAAGGDYPGPADLLYLNGKIFGVTVSGGITAGSSGYGTVYSFDTTRDRFSVAHTFRGGKTGAHPVGGLTYLNKTLYGTTAGQGTSPDFGTIFALTP